MKILKKAEQKNVTLNKEYYTASNINDMLSSKEIFYFSKNLNPIHDPISSWSINEMVFRLFTEDLTDLKVILDEYNCYTTAAIGKNGKTYFVNI